MLFILISQLALACLAAAIPSKRQSVPNLSIELSNTISAVAVQFKASTDGTVVTVDSDSAFDVATISCIEICIPEFHCDLYDKSLAPLVTLNPGTTNLDSQQVGQIICGSGLAQDSI